MKEIPLTAKHVLGVPTYWESAKAHLRDADPIMGDLIHRYEEPPLRSKGRLVQTLIRSIVGQQISATAADAVWGRFMDLIAGDLTSEERAEQLWSPEAIGSYSDDDLRAVGLSRRKVEYIRGVVAETDDLQNQPWDRLSEDAVKTRLCQLRGIGPWTAEMVMIFSLLKPDILPLGDVGVLRSIERHYASGTRLPLADIQRIAEPWTPFRTVAVWYLWRSLDPEPVLY